MYLSQKVILARLLLLGASRTLHRPLQVGQCLVETLLAQQVRGHDGIVLLGQLVGYTVAPHLSEQVVGFVVPLQLGIALRHAHACLGYNLGILAVEAGDVGEGAGSFQKLSLVELRLAHEHPRMVQEGVILLLGIPQLVLLGERTPRLLLGLLLDGVQLDGLLRLLYRLVKVASSRAARALLADGEERDYLHVVVLVRFLLCRHSLLVGLVSIVVHVEAGHKRLVEPRLSRVHLRGTACRQHEQHQQYHQAVCIPPAHY